MVGNQNTRPIPQPEALTKPAVSRALATLLEGYTYAADLRAPAWDFAIELETLVKAGANLNALGWLVRRGYAEYRLPTRNTVPASRGPDGVVGVAFPKGTCFALTEAGVQVARMSVLSAPVPLPPPQAEPQTDAAQEREEMPEWDAGAGELRYRGRVVKRFRNAGSNQRRILDAFQCLGWPRHIADPLPANRGTNSKQRLHDTIKNLNRCHESTCLTFYGLDAGHAVGWRALE
jgi:hypothetical protein